MKWFQRVISFCLAVCLTLSAVPVQTLAEAIEVMEASEEVWEEIPEGEILEEFAELPEETFSEAAEALPEVPEAPRPEEHPQPLFTEELVDSDRSASASVVEIGGKLYGGPASYIGSAGYPLEIYGSHRMINGTEAQPSYFWAPNTDPGFTGIEIYGTYTTIGNYIFSGLATASYVIIPATVTEIGVNAFHGCTGLKDVYFGGTQEQWLAMSIASGNEALASAKVTFGYGMTAGGIWGNLFWTLDEEGTLSVTGSGVMTADTEAPWLDYQDQIRYVSIGSGITSVDIGAFSNCTAMVNVDLPDTLSYISVGAFAGCSALKSVRIPNGVTVLGVGAFRECTSLASVTLSNSLTEIGSGAFFLCESLTGITIPEGVTEIYEDTFSASGLRSVTLPPKLQSIGARAFSGCVSLTAITLPDTLTKVDEYAFYNCDALTNVVIPQKLTNIAWGAFGHCDKLESFQVHPNNAAYTADFGVLFDKAYYELHTYPAGRQGTSYTVAQVREVSPYAFSGCRNLEEVMIQDTVDMIFYNAFYESKSLVRVEMKNVESLGPEAFRGCTSLSDVDLGSKLAKIRSSAFRDCTALESIAFPMVLDHLGNWAFAGCTNLKTLIFEGNAPSFDATTAAQQHFSGVTAIAYYPDKSPSWTQEVRQNYGGNITWSVKAVQPELPPEPPCALEELTGLDYLAFAQVAYEDFQEDETVRECLERKNGNKWDNVWGAENILWSELCEHIASWRVCYIKENTDNGFYAVAFENDDGQILLAYRGSKPLTNAMNLIKDKQTYLDWVKNDFPMILLNLETDDQQYADAIDAIQDVTDMASTEDIAITGHSLGGLWGDVASGYSGCKAVTFNAISALDTIYSRHPKEMGRSFGGVDVWNFKDQANEGDWMAGVTEEIASGLIIGTRLKPYTKYSGNPMFDGIAHSLASLVTRGSNGKPKLTAVCGGWEPGSVISNYMTFSDKSIDLGTGSGDYMDSGLAAVIRRTSYGGNGGDKIYTNIRSDKIIGGADWDMLDGSWGDDTYYYFKGDGADTIYDTSGDDKLYLEGFEDGARIEVYEDADSDFISILYGGSTIVSVCKKNREYSLGTLDSFKVYVNGDEKFNLNEFFNNYKSGSHLIVACPVRVEILDEAGEAVYTLTENLELGGHYTDYGNFYLYQEDDGSYGKILDLKEGYTARIVGEDDGTMRIQNYAVENGDLADPETFVNVPVSDAFTATLEHTDSGALVLAADTDGDDQVDTKFGNDGKPVPITGFTVTQEYLLLKSGKTAQLQAQIAPAELSPFLTWAVEEGSENVISVDGSGKVTAKVPGTGYVLATVTNGNLSQTLRCRVDVAEEMPDADQSDILVPPVEGVQLGSTSITSQLYSTDYAELDILLILPQNVSGGIGELTDSDEAALSSAEVEIKNTGVAMESVKFATNSDLNKYFAIQVVDDRTVRIIPTQEAIDDPKAIKSKYTDTLIVTVQGKEYPTEKLTLNVKKSTPKIKASVGTFNSFYTGQSQDITFSGGTVTEVSIYKDLPSWLSLENGTLTLTDAATAKTKSGKVYLQVQTEEWRIPAFITLTVKNSHKAPGLKLSGSTVTISGDPETSNGIDLTLKCTGKKDTLEKLKVTGIKAPEGYSISGFDVSTGKFTLHTQEGFKAGKIKLTVHFAGIENAVTLTLTVKTARVALKLSNTSLALHGGSDSAAISVTATPRDYIITAPVLTLTDTSKAKNNKWGELDVEWNDGEILIATNENTPAGAKYQLGIQAGGSKPAYATITVAGKPSVSYKLSGSLDLTLPDNTVTVTPSFKNYTSGQIASFDYDIVEMKGKKTIDPNAEEFFDLKQEGKTFRLSWTDAENIHTGNTYTLKLYLTLPDGTEISNKVNFTVKRTNVKLKLSSTKLSLNQTVENAGEVGLTCSTRDYDFRKPLLQLRDSKGKKELTAYGEAIHHEKLTVSYAEGKLSIVLGETAMPGESFQVKVKANDYSSAVTLTVSVYSAKTKISASLKAKGSVDVIREGTAITVTPSYKNCGNGVDWQQKLEVFTSKDKYRQPVEGHFDILENGDGTFTLTNKALDPNLKYKVRLVSEYNGVTVTSSQISVSVKMAAPKLSVEVRNATMFAKDKRSRAEFRISTADTALRPIREVKIKDAKYQKLFDLITLSDGSYALTYKDGVVDASLSKKTQSLTIPIQIFLEGSTSKPNMTYKLKVKIIK